METRRNRLRLLAFRRGLLRPDYPQGLQSRIRERWVIDSLEREVSAEFLSKKIMFRELVLSTFFDRKKVLEYISDTCNRLEWLNNFGLGSLQKFMTAEDKIKENSTDLINVWKNMAKSGTLASIQQHARKLYEAYIQQQQE